MPLLAPKEALIVTQDAVQYEFVRSHDRTRLEIASKKRTCVNSEKQLEPKAFVVQFQK
jgi:hypothetical protein